MTEPAKQLLLYILSNTYLAMIHSHSHRKNEFEFMGNSHKHSEGYRFKRHDMEKHYSYFGKSALKDVVKTTNAGFLHIGEENKSLDKRKAKKLRAVLSACGYKMKTNSISQAMQKMLREEFWRLDTVNFSGKKLPGVWHPRGAFLEITCRAGELEISSDTKIEGLVVLSGTVKISGSQLKECHIEDCTVRASSILDSTVDGVDVNGSRVLLSRIDKWEFGKEIRGEYVVGNYSTCELADRNKLEK